MCERQQYTSKQLAGDHAMKGKQAFWRPTQSFCNLCISSRQHTKRVCGAAACLLAGWLARKGGELRPLSRRRVSSLIRGHLSIDAPNRRSPWSQESTGVWTASSLPSPESAGSRDVACHYLVPPCNYRSSSSVSRWLRFDGA